MQDAFIKLVFLVDLFMEVGKSKFKCKTYLSSIEVNYKWID